MFCLSSLSHIHSLSPPSSLSFAVFFFFSLTPLKIIGTVPSEGSPGNSLSVEESKKYMTVCNYTNLMEQITKLRAHSGGKFELSYNGITKEGNTLIYVYRFDKRLTFSGGSLITIAGELKPEAGLQIGSCRGYISTKDMSSAMAADEREEQRVAEGRAEGRAEALSQCKSVVLASCNLTPETRRHVESVWDGIVASHPPPLQAAQSSHSVVTFELFHKTVIRSKLSAMISKLKLLYCDSEYNMLQSNVTPFSGLIDIVLLARQKSAAAIHVSEGQGGNTEEEEVDTPEDTDEEPEAGEVDADIHSRTAVVEVKRGVQYYAKAAELQCICEAFTLMASQFKRELSQGRVPTEMAGWGILVSRRACRCYKLQCSFDGKVLNVFVNSTNDINTMTDYFNFVLSDLLCE